MSDIDWKDLAKMREREIETLRRQLEGAVSLDELRAIHYALMAPFSPSDYVPGNIEDAVGMVEGLMNRLGGQ